MAANQDEILEVGCVYGQYSSLDRFSYDVISIVEKETS